MSVMLSSAVWLEARSVSRKIATVEMTRCTKKMETWAKSNNQSHCIKEEHRGLNDWHTVYYCTSLVVSVSGFGANRHSACWLH